MHPHPHPPNSNKNTSQTLAKPKLASSSQALLQVQKVTKTFGGVVANKEVSLTVQSGEIVAIIGPNGSGKTSLFNSIVGSYPIDSGSIVFNGEEISSLSIRQIALRKLLRTFQTTQVYTRMTALENLYISLPQNTVSLRSIFSVPSKGTKDKAAGLLEFIGLYDKREFLAGDLSFGQQKLLELAMSLMCEPKMLLLDEPTAGINPTLINGLIDRLKTIRKEFGVTLLVIEHNMRVVMNLAERIYCLAHGQVLVEDTPENIQNNKIVIEAYLGAQ